MWSYYGSKSRVVKLYPVPKCDTIIEPFCGSARYALLYFDREVILVDKYEAVIKCWRWLQQCSPGDILGLPKLKQGMKISELNVSEEEKLFLGFCSGIGNASPRNTVSSFSGEQHSRDDRKIKKIADNLYKIKHWHIKHSSYEVMGNRPATWFIDPPYEFGGATYVENYINFPHLANWCREREGQVIVCENIKATWMDFKPMTKMRGGNQKFTTEAIWSNEPTAFDYQQQKLFQD